MQRTRSISWVAVLATAAASACVDETARPSASVQIEPPSVCRGDGFETVVSLDASSSSSRLSLVPAAPDEDAPLTFVWELSGDDHEIVAGGLDEDRLEVTMAGERPLGVRLTVANELGAEFVTQRSVALSVDCP